MGVSQPPPDGRVVRRKHFEFAILYTPGPNYLPHLPPDQQPIGSHRAYIESLRQQRKLIQGGPFPDNDRGTDPRHGTPVLSVSGEAEAWDLVAQDPAVRAGVLQATLRPWDIRFGLTPPF